MKKIILFLALLPTLITGNSQSTIYGTQLDTILNTTFFVSVDPTSGTITQVDSLPGVQNISTGISVFNSNSEIYIITDLNENIYTINVNNGSIISTSALTAPVMELQYDKVSGNYYAIEQEISSSSGAASGTGSSSNVTTTSVTNYLVSVNPNTGVVSRVDSISNVEGIAVNTSVYDSDNELFIFIGNDNKIFTLDVNTGAVMSSPSLSTTIHELKYNPLTEIYYAIECHDQNTGSSGSSSSLGSNTTSSIGTSYLVSVDPSTGIVTQIDSIQGLNGYELGTSTLDTLNELYSVVDKNNKLFSIDLNTAMVTTQPQLNLTVNNLRINVISGGSRISNYSFEHIQAFPNPTRGSLTINVNIVPTTLNTYNRQGQLVKTEVLVQESSRIDVSSFDRGVYFLKLDNSETTETKKITIQ